MFARTQSCLVFFLVLDGLKRVEMYIVFFVLWFIDWSGDDCWDFVQVCVSWASTTGAGRLLGYESRQLGTLSTGRFTINLHVFWCKSSTLVQCTNVRSYSAQGFAGYVLSFLGVVLVNCKRALESIAFILGYFFIHNCIPRTKYVRGILWFSRRYAAAASADTSSFSR